MITNSLQRNLIRQRQAVAETEREIDTFRVAINAEGHEPSDADNRILERLYTKLKRQRLNYETTERQIAIFSPKNQLDAFDAKTPTKAKAK